MYEAVMLDLETMSTRDNAAIVSIGAVKFNLTEVQTLEQILPDQKFFLNVSLNSCEEYGMDFEAGTVLWWLSRSKEVMLQLKDGFHIGDALEMFLTFLEDSVAEDFLLFGNGATFDNVILRNAYQSCKILYPITRKQDACYRTIKRLNSDIPIVRYGVEHNALDDAISQMLHLQRMLNR